MTRRNAKGLGVALITTTSLGTSWVATTLAAFPSLTMIPATPMPSGTHCQVHANPKLMKTRTPNARRSNLVADALELPRDKAIAPTALRSWAP
mmetsp:Transcript_106675/g.130088  ORF Transcript_106675/g.130088 Transcript_106675/m.130088 type:complete len:93 (-) Transcript_106675:441-719(-)